MKLKDQKYHCTVIDKTLLVRDCSSCSSVFCTLLQSDVQRPAGEILKPAREVSWATACEQAKPSDTVALACYWLFTASSRALFC